MEYTLTRALSEIKLYDSKIQKSIKLINSAAVSQRDKILGSRFNQAEFITDYNSRMESLAQLRTNQNEIRSKLTIANATTTITINDTNYTIVEAIKRKNDIQIDKQLVQQLSNTLIQATRQADQHNNKIEQDIQSIIETKAGTAQHSKDYIKETRDAMIKLNGVSIVNESPAHADIERINSEIEEFENQIDYALSTINAITTIEINI